MYHTIDARCKAPYTNEHLSAPGEIRSPAHSSSYPCPTRVTRTGKPKGSPTLHPPSQSCFYSCKLFVLGAYNTALNGVTSSIQPTTIRAESLWSSSSHELSILIKNQQTSSKPFQEISEDQNSRRSQTWSEITGSSSKHRLEFTKSCSF